MTDHHKILIGIPIADDCRAHLGVIHYADHEQKANPNVEFQVIPTNDHSTGRNIQIEEQILAKGFTHYFTVDSDTIPPCGALETLLAADSDIIGGAYPLFNPQFGPHWSCSPYRDDKPHVHWDPCRWTDIPDARFRAHLLGSGILLIKREVFERMKPPWFERTHMRRDLIGPDLFFCGKAKELGFKLFCEPKVKCRHFKNIDLKEIFDSCYADCKG